MMGNVGEWIEDCWNGTYDGAPNDGTQWTSGDCTLRVVRGGGFSGNILNVRSALRGWHPKDFAEASTGFRLFKDLN